MLSMAMVDAVPAGQYGKQSLEALGLWAVAEPLVAQSENVRAALALVATGEAPYGIVYASDAVAGDDVTVVGQFPKESHAPITYPAALLTGASDAADRAFFEALSADAADATFAAQGFKILN
jgi:molybdate transport system substrate-binding protein